MRNSTLGKIFLFDQYFYSTPEIVFNIAFRLYSNELFIKQFGYMMKTIFEDSYPYLLNLSKIYDKRDLIITILDQIIDEPQISRNETLSRFLRSSFIPISDIKKKGRVVSKILIEEVEVKNALVYLRKSIDENSFYKLSSIPKEKLLGEWVSIKETGHLRFNYNMAGVMSLGSQILLSISQAQNPNYYDFICDTEVSDYNPLNKWYITITHTNIILDNGYIVHYSKYDGSYLFKRPLYNFHENTFQTQIDDIEFTFCKRHKL